MFSLELFLMCTIEITRIILYDVACMPCFKILRSLRRLVQIKRCDGTLISGSCDHAACSTVHDDFRIARLKNLKNSWVNFSTWFTKPKRTMLQTTCSGLNTTMEVTCLCCTHLSSGTTWDELVEAIPVWNPGSTVIVPPATGTRLKVAFLRVIVRHQARKR